MLAAAALRLAVIEALAPTAAVKGVEGSAFPTLAGWRVFDSADITPEQLEDGRSWTPCLSVFTEETTITRRGASAPSSIGGVETDLVINAELAERIEDDKGQIVADAVLNGDPLAQLTLAALTAQVRAVLVRSPTGVGVRKVLASAEKIRIEPFGLPQAGIRYMRNVMTWTCRIADDKFTDEAGFPEPMRSVAADLPEGSYARAKLDELAAAFRATTREQLEAITLAASVNGRPAVIQP